MIKCQRVVEALEALAPKSLAEDWDNVGLLVGSRRQEIRKILTCLDVTEQVVDEAIKIGADLIVAHHPLIFRGIKNIDTDTYLGGILQNLLSHKIAVYAAHTNLDTAWGGTNDLLARFLGLKDVKPLVISKREELVKLGVNVPVEQAGEVRKAMAKAGAGTMDNYAGCAFMYEGQGYFTPLEGANPFIGKENQEEEVAEVRIETIMPASFVQKVVKAMLKAHPYEVPAYDLYPTKNTGEEWGLGRIGYLPEPMELKAVLQLLKNTLPTGTLRWVEGKAGMVQKIALCTGAGAEFLHKAKFQGADLYLTGDVKYHEAQAAKEIGINLIDAGHFGTEYPMAKELANYLEEIKAKEKWQVEIVADSFSEDIFQTYSLD